MDGAFGDIPVNLVSARLGIHWARTNVCTQRMYNDCKYKVFHLEHFVLSVLYIWTYKYL